MKAPAGLFDLSGKVALITGGRRGMGRATALCSSRGGEAVPHARHVEKRCRTT